MCENSCVKKLFSIEIETIFNLENVLCVKLSGKKSGGKKVLSCVKKKNIYGDLWGQEFLFRFSDNKKKNERFEIEWEIKKKKKKSSV